MAIAAQLNNPGMLAQNEGHMATQHHGGQEGKTLSSSSLAAIISCSQNHCKALLAESMETAHPQRIAELNKLETTCYDF